MSGLSSTASTTTAPKLSPVFDRKDNAYKFAAKRQAAKAATDYVEVQQWQVQTLDG